MIFNPKEKLNIFEQQYSNVRSIAFQWNSLCIFMDQESNVDIGAIDATNIRNISNVNVCRLIENDIDEKLEVLFERQLFDVAVSICQHHELGTNNLSDVYKRWGDSLHQKGDHVEAAEKYIKTIGFLEPSYVIHKLLKGQRIQALTLYLEEIENQQKSRSGHRNLLISCYAKSKEVEKLKVLLSTCSPNQRYNV